MVLRVRDQVVYKEEHLRLARRVASPKRLVFEELSPRPSRATTSALPSLPPLLSVIFRPLMLLFLAVLVILLIHCKAISPRKWLNKFSTSTVHS